MSESIGPSRLLWSKILGSRMSVVLCAFVVVKERLPNDVEAQELKDQLTDVDDKIVGNRDPNTTPMTWADERYKLAATLRLALRMLGEDVPE